MRLSNCCSGVRGRGASSFFTAVFSSLGGFFATCSLGPSEQPVKIPAVNAAANTVKRKFFGMICSLLT